MAMYDDLMKPCFAGMKADAGDDRVITLPAGGAIAFGVLVGRSDNGTVKVSGSQNQAVIGVSLHSHAVANKSGGYEEHDAVSVMTRGAVWVSAANGVSSEDISIKSSVNMINDNGEIVTAGGTSVSFNHTVLDVKTVGGKTLVEIDLK